MVSKVPKMISIKDVLAKSNLRAAYAKVVKNKGAAGIDNMPVDELGSYMQQNWTEISEAIQQGTYRPQAVRRVEIPKPKGGVRQLGNQSDSYCPGITMHSFPITAMDSDREGAVMMPLTGH